MLHVTQAQGPACDVKYIYIAQFAPVSQHVHHTSVYNTVLQPLS